MATKVVKTNTYNEDSIVTLNYRESARQSIGMYIGNSDITGMHHLGTEIIANAMDEAALGYGKLIKVEVDTTENSFCVIDNGRGIPFHKNKNGNYAVVEMCTNMHSGGKFEGQSNYKSSLGLNGVGATVTHALSSKFVVDVWRDGEHCTFTSIDGKYNDPVIEKYSGSNQGSRVYFIPDTKVFGNLKWDAAKLKEEMQLHALLNNNITFEVVIKSGSKVSEDVKYCYKNGIKDMLQIKTADMKMITDPVFGTASVTNDAGVNATIEMAFAYSDNACETVYSFVNGGYTPNDGTHVTGWRTAYTRLINDWAKKQDIIKDKSISGDIIRRGLVLVLSLRMEERPLFAEQTKLTLNSPSARTFCSRAVSQLQIDDKLMKQIVDKIMIEQKAEDAAQRKREAQEKIARGGKSMNSLKDLPIKLADASDFSDAELFIVEGDSAAGGAKEVKTTKQAVLPLRGKIKNCTSLELADAIKSDTIKDLLVTLGCGVGDNFNINNLRYNRIIIMTDADPDGGHISLLLNTLFLHHLPELINQGKVYAAMPPLYKTINSTGKEEIYWYPNQMAEYKKYLSGHRSVTVQRFKGLGEMDANELYDTTMNPDKRKLVQLTTNDLQKSLDLYDKLMGKSSMARRMFIMENGLDNRGEEDLFDEDAEDLD